MKICRIKVLLVGAIATGVLAGCGDRSPEPTPPPVVVVDATPEQAVVVEPTSDQAVTTDAAPVPAGAAYALEDQIINIYETTRGSVVNITNRGYAMNNRMQAVPQQGSGSGFIFDDQGHIVTNFHVIENAEELEVTLADGTNLPAELVGADPSTDLAVIRIANEALPPLIPLEQPGAFRVGEFVIAIGNPFGLEGTMTVGVISSLGRIIESPNGRFIGEAIQTDAAINPGNSGGPLLNLEGRVIGVNSQIVSTSGASSGIGFAVPVGTVQRVVSQIIEQGYYAHPWLGVQTADLTPEATDLLAEAGMELAVDRGVLVIAVVEGSPAAEAGIQGGNRTMRVGNVQVPIGGDIITAVNGVEATNLQELTVYLEDNTQVGDTVTLTVVRNGELMQVDVELEERPALP
jgi:S1-C subfamily serine protease